MRHRSIEVVGQVVVLAQRENSETNELADDEEYEDDTDGDDIETEDEDQDFDGLSEDNDITDPSKPKYHKQAEEDPRTDVKPKVNKRKNDETVEGIGDRDDLDNIDL